MPTVRCVRASAQQWRICLQRNTRGLNMMAGLYSQLRQGYNPAFCDWVAGGKRRGHTARSGCATKGKIERSAGLVAQALLPVCSWIFWMRWRRKTAKAHSQEWLCYEERRTAVVLRSGGLQASSLFSSNQDGSLKVSATRDGNACQPPSRRNGISGVRGGLLLLEQIAPEVLRVGAEDQGCFGVDAVPGAAVHFPFELQRRPLGSA